ncbi:hypothetical protein [Chengkuizengella axinellae]|uniref:hypothetical protein n=1 Tax=Chengkuizengella axinellae TaxID=3064388 RepID=UPI0035288311
MSWRRNSWLGSTKDYLGKAKEWLESHPGEDLPDYFVSAMCVEKDGTPKITPKQHVDVQAVIQKHNDSAISKTTNVPANFTIEQTKELYKYGYEQGLVGLTIYRDGSRDKQVLSVDTGSENETLNVQNNEQINDSTTQNNERRPQILKGSTIETLTPFGNAYLTINENERQEIEEVFIKLGKAGADISAIADGLAIAITGMASPRISN